MLRSLIRRIVLWAVPEADPDVEEYVVVVGPDGDALPRDRAAAILAQHLAKKEN